MGLTFDELIARQYLVTFDVDVPGVGEVALHQVSASHAVEIARESEDLTGDDLETFVCRKAAEFVKGSEVSDEELSAFRGYHTAQTISLLYQSGMTNSAPVVDDLEGTEKN